MKTMKKSISILVALALLITLVSVATVSLAEDTAVKTGFAVISSLSGTDSGTLAISPTYAAVTVDADGKIVSCVIDTYEASFTIDSTGTITSDLTAEVLTKNQKGDDYGLSAYSSLGMDWYAQAAAFADYCVGLTSDEVAAIALDDSGYATDADVLSCATITVSAMIEAIVAAVENAEDLGAMSSDTLALAVVIDLESESANATDSANGSACAYAYYAAATFDADGVITSVVLDASAFAIDFDTAGVVTTDVTAAQYSKQTLKEDYGMGQYSGLGMEWYQQADAFAAYVVGLTVDEVAGIAVDESGYATDADVLAGTTIHIADFLEVIEAAYESIQ